MVLLLKRESSWIESTRKLVLIKQQHQLRKWILLDTGTGEDHGLVGQEIYLDILGFAAPGATFCAHGFYAVVRIA